MIDVNVPSSSTTYHTDSLINVLTDILTQKMHFASIALLAIAFSSPCLAIWRVAFYPNGDCTGDVNEITGYSSMGCQNLPASYNAIQAQAFNVSFIRILWHTY